jgi:Oxidoreductase family, NAD-binding Rossmann fold/Oxidoreductase family, C-terminal alpha/beta domain
MEPKAASAPSQSETPAGSFVRPITRRRFVSAGIASITMSGLAPLILPREVLGGPGAPSNTIGIACVGCGGMGRKYLDGCNAERIVALCDLDHDFVAQRGVFDKFPKATRYHDWREMFDKEAKNFDALIVATPDHTHAVILMPAIQLKKHIYCAKPATHTIAEARRVRAAVLAAKGIVTKTSAQSSGTNAACSVTEILTLGVLGPVHEVHIWCSHPIYPCSLTRPTEAQTPPRGMDWDLWIGPAPSRPFNSAYHPEIWRPWWDFGDGTVGDMATHTLHMFFRELQLGAPARVYGYGSTRCDGYMKRVDTPECQGSANVVTWEFPARGALPPLKVHWYDGGMKPLPPEGVPPRSLVTSDGILFVGEKGTMLSGYYGSARPTLLPKEKFQDFQPPPKTLRRVEETNHYTEWTTACKTGAETVCPLDFGTEMSEMALLGGLALRTGVPLEWDAKAMRVTNEDTANRYIDPPYRAGWKL